MEQKSPRRQPNKKQPIKLMSNLKKISDLNLGEKVDLMKGSVFGSLSTVSNKRESSGTLVAAICKYYDASKKLFVLNNETYFGFCSKEVADILGMEDKGIDYKDYVKQCSELPAEFPCYLKELRERFVSGRDTNGAIMSSHLKDILRNMTVDDAESKQHFRELMSYYLVEQVLLCSSNAKKPRSSMWRLINNLGTFETVNWAKATLNQLHSSLSHTKIWLEGGARGQHSFMGAAPVLETIIYERIPSMRPSKWSKDSPPVQKYASQRKNAEKWIETKLIKLTPNDIEMCPHCAASSGSHFMAAKDVTPGSFTVENTNCSAVEEEVRGLSFSTHIVYKRRKHRSKASLHHECNSAILEGMSSIPNDMKDYKSGKVCHQCKSKKRKAVVPCTNCKQKLYCIQCIQHWYPQLQEKDIANLCPFCRSNCNCNECLKSRIKMPVINFDDDVKLQHLHYILKSLLPFLKHIRKEQMEELVMEADAQGVPLSSIKIKQGCYRIDERIYCNYCSTSIVDLFRSCSKCKYEVCLACCREIRKNEPLQRLVEFGRCDKYDGHWHVGYPPPNTSCENISTSPKWVLKNNGSITCPSKELGGCGDSLLELMHGLQEDWISTLEARADCILKTINKPEGPLATA